MLQNERESDEGKEIETRFWLMRHEDKVLEDVVEEVVQTCRVAKAA